MLFPSADFDCVAIERFIIREFELSSRLKTKHIALQALFVSIFLTLDMLRY